MNFGEKLIRSPYGRPYFKMITGLDVPRDMWTDINEALVIDKGVVEASIKDIEHTFCCYEYLQKELHTSTEAKISRFTEVLSSPAQKLVSEEAGTLGRCFSQVVIRVMNAISESNSMVLSVSQIKELSLRPSTQFFQKLGSITKTIREIRMKQAGFVAAYLMAR